MRDSKGFTLIELLIVVVIIGILAAIAIPKFSATREKAYFAALKSDLKNLASQEEIYYSDNYTYSTVAATLDRPALSPCSAAREGCSPRSTTSQRSSCCGTSSPPCGTRSSSRT